MTILILMLVPFVANAQQQQLSEEELKKANDPMANTKAFNIHNYIVSRLYGLDGTAINQTILRYAQPFVNGKVLMRASMPFVVSSSPNVNPTNGLGDLNMFAIYSFSPSEGNKLGVGPQFVLPTGTNDLGAGKWQAGATFLAFFAKSHIIQFGTLLQYQFSFAGEDDRPDVSLLIPQVFFMWQLGGGTYLRSTGISQFDLKTGHYAVPLGLGAGKVVKAGKIVFNLFAEPQFTVMGWGIGQPRFQTFVGFNTQF